MAFNQYMHERNIYKNRPDFSQMALDFPKFRKYTIPDDTGKKVRVDFSDPEALRVVTEILLRKDFNLDVEIPQGYLVPTVTQRLNYILWLEDLLKDIPLKEEFASGIDIGTGPCAIFSIIGARKNNWSFIATETSDDAIMWAEKNIEKNNLTNNIEIVKIRSDTTLSEVLSTSDEDYDFCMCNPPFFGNVDEIRKKHRNSKKTIADVAQKEEIFCDGGELKFVQHILNDSIKYKDRISVFSSMFGKKSSFLQILKQIKALKDAKVSTTEFCQGNTIRWGIAWTFNESIHLKKINRKIVPKRAKPPLEYQIPVKNPKKYNFPLLITHTKNFFESLQIPVSVTKSTKNFAELHLKSDVNTWCHQRRKRREAQRKLKEAGNLKKDPSCTSVSEIPEVQRIDSEAIQKPNISQCADVKESKFSRDDNGTDCKSSSVIISCETVTSLKRTSETSQEKDKAQNDENEADSELLTNTVDSGVSQNESDSNKRKVLCHDNSPTIKKARLDASLMSENSIISDENRNLKVETTESEHKESHVSQATDGSAGMELNVEKKLETSDENGTESLSVENYKTKEMDEVCPMSKSDSSSNTKTEDTLNTIQNKQNEDITGTSLSVHMVSEPDCKEKVDNFSTQQGSVLDCYLHLIMGKNKVYAKMNCPFSGNRDTMNQIFLLMKNEIK